MCVRLNVISFVERMKGVKNSVFFKCNWIVIPDKLRRREKPNNSEKLVKKLFELNWDLNESNSNKFAILVTEVLKMSSC
jgi:hypothetical protein